MMTLIAPYIVGLVAVAPIFAHVWQEIQGQKRQKQGE
jgi:hypothetical protein